MKISISELKQNGTGAMTTAKYDVFIGLYFENVYLVGGRGGLTCGWEGIKIW